MAALVLDQARDISGQETHRLTSLYPPPEFVKTADVARLCGEPESQVRSLYAEPHEKLYPCHTAPATWMSSLFYFSKQASFRPQERSAIEERLLAAADWFSIRGEVDELRTKVAANEGNEVAQLSDDDFAIVWVTDGQKTRHWPLRNAKEAQFAAAHLVKHQGDFRFPDRHTIANKILTKAAAYGASLEENEEPLAIMAGNGGCSGRTAAEMLETRAAMTHREHTALSQEMRKLATVIREKPAQARGREQLVKIANVVDQFDYETGLHKMYGLGGLPRPEEVLFQLTEKVAADFTRQHVPTTTGNLYDRETLEKLSAATIREWMGDEFTEAVTAGGLMVDGEKLASILPTLDRGAASMFDRLMHAAGNQPVIREKTASDSPLSRERLFALAAGGA